MALIKNLPGKRPAGSSYWVLDGYSYSAESNKTTINLSGWENEAVFKKCFPAADDRITISVDGFVTGPDDCLDRLMAAGEKLEGAAVRETIGKDTII